MASNYPTSADGLSSLLKPVDKTSTKALSTTLTAAALSGDTTLSVADTSTPGFASTYGVLSIGDELVIYSGKTSNSFTGCQRGMLGSTATGHANGSTVTARMVAGFLDRIHESIIAIQNTLGVDGSYNFVTAATAIVTSFVGRTGAVTAQGGDYTAAQITNAPTGNLAGATVQAALNELQTDLDGRAATSHTHPASDVASGQVALARGGTNADLSATGGASQVLRQSTAGAAVTVSQLAAGDVSGLAAIATSGSASDLGAGTIPAARVGQSSVTQHQAALAIATTQIDANVSAAEFGYLDGVTSALQAQLNGKAAELDSLRTRMTAAESAIATLQSEVATIQSTFATTSAMNSALAGKSSSTHYHTWGDNTDAQGNHNHNGEVSTADGSHAHYVDGSSSTPVG